MNGDVPIDNLSNGELASHAWDLVCNYKIRQGWNTYMIIYKRGRYGNNWRQRPEISFWEQILVAFILLFILLVLLGIFLFTTVLECMAYSFSENAQLYTGILPILVILIEFCSAHPHARPHNHHTVDFCSPCRGGSASAHNHSYTRPVIEQQNFDLLKLHLYGKLVDIQRKFNNVKVILRQRVNETANRFNVIVLIQSYQAAANIVSPSLRMYNILKQISHFTRMTLNPFASRQGVCLQNLWQQSDVELAMCYMVQLMASRNIVLPEHVCNERVFAELVTDSEDIRQQMLNDLDRFTNKINQLRRLQIDADMEWCKALEDSDSQES